MNSPLYDKKTGQAKEIPWNFAKFLLNSKGQVVGYFDPVTEPNQMLEDIKSLLK